MEGVSSERGDVGACDKLADVMMMGGTQRRSRKVNGPRPCRMSTYERVENLVCAAAVVAVGDLSCSVEQPLNGVFENPAHVE